MNQIVQNLGLLTAFCLGTSLAGAAVEVSSLDALKASGALQSSYRNWKAADILPEAPKPALERFRREIGPILKSHCVQCHGPKKAKARLRIDTLDPDLFNGKDVDWWLEVQAVLGNGEMPPPEEAELSGEGRAQVMDWLAHEIRMASMTRRAEEGHSSFRRMTRYEYNHALQDLLGIPGNFARDLPPEAHSEDGFQNTSETLHMSVSQLETYRRVAREALLRATVHGSRPSMLHWGVPMKRAARIEWARQDEKLAKAKDKFKDDPEKQETEVAKLLESFKRPHRGTHFKDLTTGRTAQHTWSYYSAKYALKPTNSPPEAPKSFEQVAILPRGQALIVELGEKIPDEGTMRVRVRVSRLSADDQPDPSLQLEFGWKASNEGRARFRVSKADVRVTSDPTIYQWDIPLATIYPRNGVRKTSPLGTHVPNPSEYIRFVNSSASPGDIRIDYVEVATPVYEQWPPASYHRIFGQSDHRDDEPVYAREVLSKFMSRAWRRQVSRGEIGQKLRLFEEMRDSCETFEACMVEVLATVLSSSEFLYLRRDNLATRLSMFLWSSVPDDRLLAADLRQPDALAAEVKRMLADARSERFARQFVRQWLNLQLLDYVEPNSVMNELVKEVMQEEPVAFFVEVMRRDESVLNFIHADYGMVNERLAHHYGIPGIHGNHLRRVKLDPAHRRGGLLTQAGLLAMNSAGTNSHPLKRGIWMLESILNDPPPPPPPAVPEIDLADPRIAQMTLKERIEDHRNHPACMSCHAKIDPWGIAFENYDAMGRWRDRINGKPVDATSRLFNNEPLNGMDGLKRFLLKNRQDQFVRAMTHKMTVYALGRPLTFADRAGVEGITARVRQQGDGLATLISMVATSKLFATP